MTIFDEMSYNTFIVKKRIYEPCTEFKCVLEPITTPLPNWTLGGTGMTEKEYNELNAVRRSDLLKLRKTAQHYKWAKEHPEEPTPAMVFGAACHKLVLEGLEAFRTEYAVAPVIDRRTKDGREEWADFLERSAGKTVISQDDFIQICDMRKAVMEHSEAPALLSGEHEQSYVWTDTETGLDCKIRLDCLTEWEKRPVIVDYKTVSSCEDGMFERECRKFGYKIQAGMYTEGLLMATNFVTDAGFMFVAQEKTPPYAVRVYNCDPGFIEQGNREFHELLRWYKMCNETDCWPGYEDGYLMADPWLEVAE